MAKIAVFKINWKEQYDKRWKESFKTTEVVFDLFRSKAEVIWQGYHFDCEVYSWTGGSPSGIRTGVKYKVDGRGNYKIKFARLSIGGGLVRNSPELATDDNKLNIQIGTHSLTLYEEEIIPSHKNEIDPTFNKEKVIPSIKNKIDQIFPN